MSSQKFAQNTFQENTAYLTVQIILKWSLQEDWVKKEIYKLLTSISKVKPVKKPVSPLQPMLFDNSLLSVC